MPDTDPFESQRVLGERIDRIQARLLPFLEPLVKDALRRGVRPPRRDDELEDAQNFLFMIPKDDPIREEIAEYEKQKPAGRTITTYEPWQIDSLGEFWGKQAALLLWNVLHSAYMDRIGEWLAPGCKTPAPPAPAHLHFYRDEKCVGDDMLPVDADVREIDDWFWHTVLTVDEVRGALAAYKAALPPGAVIDEDLALILDGFLKEVEADRNAQTGP